MAKRLSVGLQQSSFLELHGLLGEHTDCDASKMAS